MSGKTAGVVSVVTLVASLAAAQVYYRPGYNRPYGYGYGGYGYGGFGATTAAQSYAYGMSAMIRSQAAANQMNAQAAVVAEQAKREALETQKQYTQTYFELRRMNREYRAAEEAEKAAQRTTSASSYTAQMPPKRLSPNQLDPVTGKIGWTATLMDDAFRPYREALNQMYAERAQKGRVLDIIEVHGEVQRMRDLLDARINNLTSMDWLAAKQLLDGLERELRMPVG